MAGSKVRMKKRRDYPLGRTPIVEEVVANSKVPPCSRPSFGNHWLGPMHQDGIQITRSFVATHLSIGQENRRVERIDVQSQIENQICARRGCNIIENACIAGSHRLFRSPTRTGAVF